MTETTEPIANRYRTFAQKEARGSSWLYERFAVATSESKPLLERLAKLPNAKQQPNLLFAATRQVAGLPEENVDFSTHCLAHWSDIADVMRTRSTQTNEPARCACLLPALSTIEGPLAILEVGAAAGLGLLLDQYGYDYGHRKLATTHTDAPEFKCTVTGPAPLTQKPLEIVWRAGIDLNPLNVHLSADMDWLRLLVWPEHVERLANLEAAIAVAQQDPPLVVGGDALDHVRELAATAPKDASLVIFHSAFLNYLANEKRRAFVKLVRDIGAHWLSNEGARVVSQIQPPADTALRQGAFLMSLNGTPLAQTGPHGQFLDWF